MIKNRINTRLSYEQAISQALRELCEEYPAKDPELVKSDVLADIDHTCRTLDIPPSTACAHGAKLRIHLKYGTIT